MIRNPELGRSDRNLKEHRQPSEAKEKKNRIMKRQNNLKEWKNEEIRRMRFHTEPV